MFEQAETCYQALQMNRERLDRRAAEAWIAASAIPATDRHFSLRVVVVRLAALIGWTGTAAMLAGAYYPSGQV